MPQDFPYSGPLPRFKAPSHLRSKILGRWKRRKRLYVQLCWASAAVLALLLSLNLRSLKSLDQGQASQADLNLDFSLNLYSE